MYMYHNVIILRQASALDVIPFLFMIKVTASSLEGAKYLIKLCSGGPLADKVNQGVLIGSGHILIMSH